MIGSPVQFGNTQRRFPETPRVATQKADEYRRRARRLRRKYEGKPGLLHRKLRELARGTAQEIPTAEQTQGLPSPTLSGDGTWGQGIARQFAQQVAERIEGGVLRYSQRVTLIREAERLGIKRFDANLIIAIVQQRTGRAGVGQPERSAGSRSLRGWWPMLGAAIALQAAIAGVAWWVIR